MYNGDMALAVAKTNKMLQKASAAFRNPFAFTLAEIISVIVILSIMSAFAIPNYVKGMRKGYERNMALNLMAIHGANEIYRAKSGGNDEYLPGTDLPLSGVPSINSGLSLDLIDDKATYDYDRTTATTYTVTATLPGVFTLTVNQDALTDANPCCTNILSEACRLRQGCP